MNKYCILLILVIVPVTYFDFSHSNHCYAGDKHIHKTYKQRLIKSRADRAYTNDGTIIYNYNVIDSYDDDLSGEDIGNVDVGNNSRVREINNVVIIRDDVKSKKEDLEIGKISVKRSNRVRSINNSVIIDGKIDASGESIKIGTVHIKKGGKVQSLDNRVDIDGEINAK